MLLSFVCATNSNFATPEHDALYTSCKFSGNIDTIVIYNKRQEFTHDELLEDPTQTGMTEEEARKVVQPKPR